jgi:hypothetical protein
MRRESLSLFLLRFIELSHPRIIAPFLSPSTAQLDARPGLPIHKDIGSLQLFH